MNILSAHQSSSPICPATQSVSPMCKATAVRSGRDRSGRHDFRQRRALDDFNDPFAGGGGRLGGTRALIAAIGENTLNEWKQGARAGGEHICEPADLTWTTGGKPRTAGAWSSRRRDGHYPRRSSSRTCATRLPIFARTVTTGGKPATTGAWRSRRRNGYYPRQSNAAQPQSPAGEGSSASYARRGPLSSQPQSPAGEGSSASYARHGPLSSHQSPAGEGSSASSLDNGNLDY